MLRYTVREMFMVIAIVAVSLAWLMNCRYLTVELDRSNRTSNMWHGRSNALERVLRTEGWRVTWDTAEASVQIIGEKGPWYVLSTDDIEPVTEASKVIPLMPRATDSRDK